MELQSSARCTARTASAAFVVAAAAAGLWVLFTFPPATTTFYPRCVFFVLTGLQCPGCGITRALHELLHGRVLAALRLNAMLLPMFIVALCAAPSAMRGKTPRFFTTAWFGWTSVVVVCGWWIVRNVV
jgi:fatty acid desaturase